MTRGYLLALNSFGLFGMELGLGPSALLRQPNPRVEFANMGAMSTPPGWYYADGDPVSTQRYWDGTQWQGGPQPTMGYSSPGFATAGGGHDPDRSPFEWYKLALSRWNKFDGRSRRAEYWWFAGVNLVIIIGLYIAMFGLFALSDGAIGVTSVAIVILFFVYALAMFLPGLAVAIRRLHDTDKSGWWVLIGIIPVINYIGGFVLLIFYCMDGTKGPNRFGSSPKY